MWPDIRGLFGSYFTMDMPKMLTASDNPWGKRSRNHIGDHTAPKAKMSKHRKKIKGGLTK